MSDIEKIENNYKTFKEIIDKLENNGLTNLVETLGEDLVLSPANAQKDEHSCFAGGLIDFALLLSQHMRKLNVVAGYEEEAKEIYTVAFLRAFGEYGTSKDKMFDPHDSDWHIEKLGLLYKRNPNLKGTNWTTRAIELATVFGVKLSSEAVMAILTAENDQPSNNLGKLLKSANLLI